MHGHHAKTTTSLAGFCPCRSPPGENANATAHRGTAAANIFRDSGVAGSGPPDGSDACYCCCSCCGKNHVNPSFDDWLLVDKLQLPADLAPGEYVLGQSDNSVTPFIPRICLRTLMGCPPSPFYLLGGTKHPISILSMR